MIYMKRFILLIMICLPVAAMAQVDPLAPLIDKYSSMEKCSTIILSSDMLKNMGVDAGVEYMQVISVDNPALISEFRSELEHVAKGYSLLMSVNSDGSNVRIYQVIQVFESDDGGKRKEQQEFLIMSLNANQGVAVRLVGNDIKLNEATSLIGL